MLHRYDEIHLETPQFMAFIEDIANQKIRRLKTPVIRDLATLLQHGKDLHDKEAFSRLTKRQKLNFVRFVAAEMHRMGIVRVTVDAEIYFAEKLH